MSEKKRCSWCNEANPVYVAYHDEEWGVPVHNDSKLFEMLVLEMFQSGLSWECVLNKREAFRRAFCGFDCTKVAVLGDEDIARLQEDKGIIRCCRKIKAAIGNARVFMEIQREWGSFATYLWSRTDGNVIHETGICRSPLSESISEDLRKRGMRFVGPVSIYAYLQAVGVIQSHERGCFLHSGD